MSTQAPSTLHHFLTDLHSDNCSPIQILDKNIKTLERKAFALDILAKISYIALIAIIGIVLAVSYNLLPFTGAISAALPLIVISIIPISWAGGKLPSLAHQFFKRAEIESGVRLELKEIENWTADKVSDFLSTQEIDPEKIPFEALKQIHSTEPLKALLPLIARFNYFYSKAHNADTQTTNLLKNIEKQEFGTELPADPQFKFNHRFATYEHAARIYEREVCPSIGKAALLLHLIENPTAKHLGIDGPLGLQGTGQFVPRSFDRRLFGRHVKPIDDSYFHFNPEDKREPLPLGFFQKNFKKLNALRQELFQKKNEAPSSSK